MSIDFVVEGWTDWSTGRPRPAFKVNVVQRWWDVERVGESGVGRLADELETSVAVDRFEREIKWVAENIHEITRLPMVGSEDYSDLALYALVLLAAARANVNPARVRFAYTGGGGGRGPRPLTLQDVIANMVNLVNDALDRFDVENTLISSYLNYFLGQHIDLIWSKPRSSLTLGDVFSALAEIISRSNDEPDVFTVYSIAHIAYTLFKELKAYLKFLEDKFGCCLSVILQRAVEEAQDPDVMRLATILKEVADEIEKVYKHIDITAYSLAEELDYLSKADDPNQFRESKTRIIAWLREAADHMHKAEEKLEQLETEAYKIVGRLEKRSLLLTTETEEDIKRRLLEA